MAVIATAVHATQCCQQQGWPDVENTALVWANRSFSLSLPPPLFFVLSVWSYSAQGLQRNWHERQVLLSRLINGMK